MLAVIAIIVIIISILLPAVSKGRQRAQFVICRSNLHQIFIGSRSYSNETTFMPNAYSGGTIVWVPEVYSFMPEPNVFYCPTAPPQAKWAGPTFGSGLPAQWGYKADQHRISTASNFSYGHNNGGSNDSSIPSLGVGDYVGHNNGYQGWNKVARVVAPSNFIMYGDSTVDGLWDHFIDEDIQDALGRTEYPADRHDQGAHLAFADGHVEWDLQVRLWILGTEGTVLPEMRRRWNNDNQPH